MRRALALLWLAAPGETTAKAALLVLQGLMPAVIIYATKRLVDALALALQTPGSDSIGVLTWVGVLGVLALAAPGVAATVAVVTEALQLAVTDHVLSLIHAKSAEVDLAQYEGAQHKDMMYRAQRDAPHRPTEIIENLGSIGQNAITVASLVGLLFAVDWSMAALFVLAVVPGVVVRTIWSRRLYTMQRSVTPLERRWLYFHWLLTLDDYAKEVRLFGLGSVFSRRARKLRRALTRGRIRFSRRRALAEFLAELPGSVAVLVGVIYVTHQALTGSNSLGDIVAFIQAVMTGHASLRNSMASLVRLYEENLFLANLFEFLDLKPRIADRPSAGPVQLPMREGLAIDHVRFTYDAGTPPILHDVTLAIRPGEHIALVGANGAGKTTLAKLLCRLYDPTDGRITWDGVDLRDLKIGELRRQTSVIFQDHAHFNLTARENIWLGDTALKPHDSRIDRAASAAGADTFIARLRYGFGTRLGRWQADDQEISIGEWQKIAIARALVRDSSIIILDEPTSALDAASESEVFQGLRKLAAGRTMVLISHRYSTVRMVDRIYVLSSGRIIESGSHRELIEKGGEYAKMYALQALNYRS